MKLLVLSLQLHQYTLKKLVSEVSFDIKTGYHSLLKHHDIIITNDYVNQTFESIRDGLNNSITQ